MNSISPERIGKDLVNRWNQLSSEDHQSIYDDNVIFICSLAKRLVGDTAGKLCGKKTLMAYWQLVRLKYPDMKMVLHRSDWYGEQIMMELSLPPLSTRAYGLISLNKQKKICRLKLSHV